MQMHHNSLPQGGGSANAGNMVHWLTIEIAHPGGYGIVAAEANCPGVAEIRRGAGFDGGGEGQIESGIDAK
jgi:hypothetical protein